jgi:Fe-S-cluster containining protein
VKHIPVPERTHYPESERQFPWLALLLDAYAVIDKGIKLAVGNEERKRSVTLTCKKGCTNCCRNLKDIPVYPLELAGMYWFAVEKVISPERAALKKRLLNHARWAPCPFLLEGACSIHPLRPAACRQFNVFTVPCAEGEDPYYTRRGDVLTPLQDYVDQAFSIMLPFYGVTNDTDKERIIEGKLLHTQARVMQSLNWYELARRMDDFDFNKR